MEIRSAEGAVGTEIARTESKNAAARVFLGELRDGYPSCIRQGCEFTGVTKNLKWGDHVVVKPNLTFPVYRKGVMTNPDAVKAVVEHFRDFTNRITICESDSGGYNRFSMDEVFQVTGIADMANRYGISVTNLTNCAARPITIRASWRTLSIPIPTLLLDDTDLFITMPVPKVHANTVVSLSVKNQWGIIQDPALRLKLHPYFKHVVYGINKALPSSISIMDGKYGLDRNGPMRGDAVDLNWLLVADNIFVADFIALKLVGVDYGTVPYLKHIFKKEGIDSLDCVVMNTDYRPFRKGPFSLRRELTDYPGLLTFSSRLLAYIGYESPLAKPLHWLLYRFREPFY